MPEIYNVKITESVKKSLKKVPLHIAIKFQGWVDAVGEQGWSVVCKTPGYHDEPLKGKRTGQRSIRLNKAYRAIYIIDKSNAIHFIEVQEVNKHEY